MEISAVGSSTSLDTTAIAQAAIKKQDAAESTSATTSAITTQSTSGGKPAGVARPVPPAGGAAKSSGAATQASGTSSTSTDNSKIYDTKDANKDGTVSYQEEMQYLIKHPEEAAKNLETVPSYDQQGNATSTPVGPSSLIDLLA